MARNETTPELLTTLHADAKEFLQLLERYIAVAKATPEEVRERMPIYGFQQIKGALDRTLPKLRGYSGKFDNWEKVVEKEKAAVEAERKAKKKG